jgi:hypothetical protein
MIEVDADKLTLNTKEFLFLTVQKIKNILHQFFFYHVQALSKEPGEFGPMV